MLYYTFKFVYDLVRNHERGGFSFDFGRQGFLSFMHILALNVQSGWECLALVIPTKSAYKSGHAIEALRN